MKRIAKVPLIGTTTLAEAEAWEYTTANPTLRAGPEYREGVAAFAEKRPPRFHSNE